MPRTANPDKTTTNKRSKEALGATENDAVVQIPVVLPKEVRDDIAKIARNTPVEGSESEEKHTIFSFLESRYSLRNMILGDAEKFKAEAATFADTPSQLPNFRILRKSWTNSWRRCKRRSPRFRRRKPNFRSLQNYKLPTKPLGNKGFCCFCRAYQNQRVTRFSIDIAPN